MASLTKAQRACLEYYRDNENNPVRVSYPPCTWTIRQTNIALDRGWLCVGPGGWHVLTPAGRQALTEPTNTTEETK